MLELVEHRGAAGMRLRLPGDGDLFADAAEQGAFLGGGGGLVKTAHQQPADDLLLLEQRPARRFGGMGGENRLEHQALEHVVHGGEPETGGGKATQRVFQTSFLGRGPRSLGTQVVAAPTDAVHPLGEVHDVEVRREAVHQLGYVPGPQPPDGGFELGVSRSPHFPLLAPADRPRRICAQTSLWPAGA